MGGSGKSIKDPEAEKRKALAKEKKDSKKIEKATIAKNRSQGPNYTIIRFAGSDINGDKPVSLAITKIKGIGWVLSKAVCLVGGFDPKEPLKDFDDEKLKKLEDVLKNPTKYGIPKFMINRQKDPKTGEDNHLVGADLQVQTKFDIESMIKLKTYRGWRHMHGQPVRGQRTRSKFREKGRSVGVLRKSVRAAAGQKSKDKK